MGTGKWFYSPPSPLSVVFAIEVFSFFHPGSLLGNADETMQAKMAFELFLKS